MGKTKELFNSIREAELHEMENQEIQKFDFENQKKKLQSLVIEYQDKIKEYEYWKDHYAILQHQFENKQEMSVQKRIPKYVVTHLHMEKERFDELVKREIAQLIAEELVKSNSIEIQITDNQIYGEDEFTISAHFQFIKS